MPTTLHTLPLSIFDKHISKTAQVTTDEWKGYKPIRDFDITQIPSNDGKNFPTLHKIIHQVKSWIRGIYSWVSEFNIDRYLAEYSFRINRSQNKDTIFNNLIKRLIERKPISNLSWYALNLTPQKINYRLGYSSQGGNSNCSCTHWGCPSSEG